MRWPRLLADTPRRAPLADAAFEHGIREREALRNALQVCQSALTEIAFHMEHAGPVADVALGALLRAQQLQDNQP